MTCATCRHKMTGADDKMRCRRDGHEIKDDFCKHHETEQDAKPVMWCVK